MIRINLLGVERQKKARAFAFDPAQHLTYACVAVLLVAAAAVGWWYWSLSSQSAAVDAQLAAAQQEMTQLRRVIAQVQQLGGAVLVPAMTVKSVGRFAILKDPQGAVFGVLALALAAAGIHGVVSYETSRRRREVPQRCRRGSDSRIARRRLRRSRRSTAIPGLRRATGPVVRHRSDAPPRREARRAVPGEDKEGAG